MAEDEVPLVNWPSVAMFCVVLGAILLFLAGVVTAMYFAVQWLGLQAAIAWAAFIVLALLLIRIEYQRKREQERVLADRKREQYFELLELLRACFYSDDPVQAARGKEKDLQSWSLRLSLIGSEDVLRAWHHFCEIWLFGPGQDQDEEEDEEENEEDDSLFAAQVRLIMALRRDCGHPATRPIAWHIGEILEIGE